MIKDLRSLRIKKGLSQEQLAKLTGLSRQTISNTERRHFDDPDGKTIREIAKALQISIPKAMELYLATPKRKK